MHLGGIWLKREPHRDAGDGEVTREGGRRGRGGCGGGCVHEARLVCAYKCHLCCVLYPIFLVGYRRICTRVASQVQISPVSPTSNLTCDLNIFSSAHPAGQCASFRVIRYNFVSTSMFLLCLLFARVSSPIGAFI